MGRRTEQPQMRHLAVLALVVIGFAAWLIPQSDAQASAVVINELVASNTQLYPDGDGDFEDWIELYNPGASPVDLTGWTIEDSAAVWPIPAGVTIPADGYLVIFASDKGDPLDPDFPGPFGELHANFQLTSAGESVTLRDETSAVVASLTYPALATDTSWGTDGLGGYVVRPTADVSPLAANPPIPPTPTPTPTPPVGDPSLVFNEIMASNGSTIADGDGDFEDWFELFNPTCATISLDGWRVADSAASWDVPAGLALAPGDVLLVWASDKGDPLDPGFPGPFGELHTNFQIASAGETLSLLDDEGFLVAQVATPVLATDESAVRQDDGSYQVATGTSVTPGARNPGQSVPDCTPTPTPTPSATATPGPTATATPNPTVTPGPTATPDPGECVSGRVLINELMPRNGGALADGDGDFPDWVELRNAGAGDVDLTGWTISDRANTWPFPAGTTIAEDGFLIVFTSDKGDPDDPKFPGPEGELHANFRLSGDGETVTVADDDGCVVDVVTYSEVDENESYGRTSSGGFGVFRIGFTTPGRPNGALGPVAPDVCFSSGNPPIRMNRIVADNEGILVDGDGDESDFVELLNQGFAPIDLTLWQISDSGETWVFPPGTTIAGRGGTLVVWASGKGFVLDEDFPGPAGELHTSFRLSADGEVLTLAEPSSCIVERVEYPPLGEDQAYGFGAAGERVIVLPGQREAPCAEPGSIVIAGVMSRNDSFLADDDGDFEDWFELRNTTADTIDLSAWVVSDSGAAWVVPNGIELAPDEAVLIWASDKNRGEAGGVLHTNFGLSGDGETLTVGSSLDCPVDAVTFPELDDDQLYRRLASGVFAVQGGSPPDEPEDDDDDPAGTDTIIVTGGCVAITELMARNDSTIEDDDGEFGDWIELANVGDEAIDLSGWTIADENDEWTIPDGVEIDAGAFLLIWADEGDRGGPDEELHTTFRLGGEGEPVTLIDAEGTVVASVSGYPELEDDESFGIDADGAWVVRAAGDATPGAGPTITTGCDFTVEVAGAAEAPDAEATDEQAHDAAEDETTELPTTGTTVRFPSVMGQLFVVVGLGLVGASVVSGRRNAR